MWVCRRCVTANPLDASVCLACGATIFEVFAGESDQRPAVEPSTALRAGLLVPGRGQTLVGLGPLGLLIALTIAFSLVFGITLLASGALVPGLILVLTGLAMHVVGAVDAGRVAAGASMLLKPRVLTGAAGLLFLVLLVAAWQAGTAG